LKLPLETVRQLFDQVLTAHAARKVDLRHRRPLMRQLQSEIGSIDGVSVTAHPADADSRSRVLCRFVVPDPDETGIHFRSDELRLEYDTDHRLRLRFRSRDGDDCLGPVGDYDQIEQLVLSIRQCYREQKARQRQQHKVRELRRKSVLAEVRRIAEAESCRWHVTEEEDGFLVSVSLGDDEPIEVTLPRRGVGEALPELSAAIAGLRNR